MLAFQHAYNSIYLKATQEVHQVLKPTGTRAQIHLFPLAYVVKLAAVNIF